VPTPRATTTSADGSVDGTHDELGGREVWRGALLLVLGLALGLSSSKEFRLEVNGMLVHPYLFVLVVLAAVTGPAAYGRLPASQRNALLGFAGAFVGVSLLNGDALPEVAKAGTFLATIWTLAVAARRLPEVRLGALGMCVSIALVSTQALGQSGTDPYAPVPFGEVGNRNAFSLYALPAILTGVVFTMHRATPKWQRLAFLGCVGITTLAIFLTANRSGWVGALTIAVLVAARGRSLRDVFIVVVMGFSIFYLLSTFFGTQVIDERLDRDQKTKQSDTARSDLFWTSVNIGLANPLTGIGPQLVDDELGKRVPLGGNTEPREAHNLQGYLIAGGGLPLTVAFVWLLVALWRRPKEWSRAYPRPGPLEVDGRSFLQMMVALFFIRGLFSQEIWSIPGFLLGFGFALAMSIVGFETTTPAANEASVGPRTARRSSARSLIASSSERPSGAAADATDLAATPGGRDGRRPNLIDREFQRRQVLGLSARPQSRRR
jgi:O-antigen ligase